MYIVRENPIFGIGWNTFYLVYPEYNYYIQGPNVLMYHAHNLYLNILAETGIPGLLSFLAVIVGSCYYICSFGKGICSDKLHRIGIRRFSYRSSFLVDCLILSSIAIKLLLFFGNSLVGLGPL